MNSFIVHTVIIVCIAIFIAYILWKYFDRRYRLVITQAMKDKEDKRNEYFQSINSIRELTEILKAMPVGVKIYGRNGDLLSSNLRDREIFGVPETVDLMQFTILDSPVLPKTIISSFKAQLPFADTLEYDFSKLDSRYQSKLKHTTKWLKVSGHPIMNADGSMMDNYVVTTEDVSEEYKQKTRFSEIKKGLNFLSANAGISIWGIDISTKEAYDIEGNSIGYGKIPLNDMLLRVHHKDRSLVEEIITSLIDGKEDSSSCEFRFLEISSKRFEYVRCKFSLIRDVEGNPQQIFGLHFNISDKMQLKGKIDELEGKISGHKSEIASIRNNLNIVLTSGNINLFKFDLKTRTLSYIFASGTYFSDIKIDDILNRTDNDTANLLRTNYKLFVAGEIDHLSFTYPYFILNKITYSRVNLHLVKNSDGSPNYVIGTQQDITDERNIERRIRLNSLRSRMALEASGAEYWEYDAVKRIFKKMPTDDLIERVDTLDNFINSINVLDMTPDLKRSINALKECLNTSLHLDVKMKDDSETNWHNYTLYIIPSETDNNGRVLTYACVKHDTTNFVRMHDEIVQKNAQIELALSSGHILPFTIDVDSGLVTMPFNNTIANNIFGAYSHSIKIDRFIEHISNGDNRLAIENMFAKLKSGELMQQQLETAALDRFGTNIYIETYFIGSNYDNTGIPSVITGIVQDVTEQRTLLARLEKAKKQAEESNKLKSAFLANMSHEIRTPLNAIIGFSSLLVETDDASERKMYSSIIELNKDQLLQLINDILDLSKIEAGMMVLQPRTFDLVTVFEQSAQSLQQKCKDDKPEVEFIIDNPYRSCLVTLDSNRLSQIWRNYVSNSIKHTYKGTITMGYRYENHEIYLYVVDTGRGIEKEKQNYVFKRFQKLNDSAPGTGLGLSIVKAIAEQFGGSVGFESEFGKGSTFFARIPCDAKIEPLI